MNRKEVIFGIRYGKDVKRCHAEVVEALPVKTNRWTNGYAEIGVYDIDDKTYRIFSDRDQHDAFGYYAIEQ